MSTSFGGTAETGDDFIDSFQLPVRFAGSYVEHSRRITDVSRGLRNVLTVENWSRGEELGRGGFGTVYLEREKNGRVRAVKEVPKQTGRTRTMDHLREVLAMAHFSKEEAFFVTLQGWYQNDSHIYIAMEFFPNGDLCNCVLGALPEKEVQVITHQLLEALQFMHQRKFTHRDLKPSNVFVVSRAPNWWVKLGDFGVSKRVMNDSTSMHTSIETEYTAPEITGHLMFEDASPSYTSAVDMWSLGCLVHWLLTYQLPLSRRNLMPYCMGKIPFPLEQLEAHQSSEVASDFVCKLLRPLPQERLTAGGALDHAWPQSSDFESTMGSDFHAQIGSASGSTFTPFLEMELPMTRLYDADYPNPSSNLKLSPFQPQSPDEEFYVPRPESQTHLEGRPWPKPIPRSELAQKSQFILKGQEIEPAAMERKIKQMLGNEAEFEYTSYLGERAYIYWANREFTNNQIEDLKNESLRYLTLPPLRNAQVALGAWAWDVPPLPLDHGENSQLPPDRWKNS